MTMADNKPTGTFYLIPHTHWEGAVFQTREAYLDVGLPNILRALALLKAFPEYRFTLDQACYVKPFLERYPEQVEAFRRFVDEGRLAIVGGTDTMLDVNMPGGESSCARCSTARATSAATLGVDVTVGWQLDTFGHHAQMPQLLKLAGLRSFWFFRGVPGWDTPAEFLWEGLDGTRIPAFWLPRLRRQLRVAATLPEFGRFMEDRYDELGRFHPGPLRAGPVAPMSAPPRSTSRSWWRSTTAGMDAGLRLRLATPAEYEAARHSGRRAGADGLS